MSNELFNFEEKDGIAKITIQNGRSNLLTTQMIREFSVIVSNFEKNPNLRCVLIQGCSKSFSTGVDLTELRTMNKEHCLMHMNAARNLFGRIRNLNIPVIGLIEGLCFGGGFELALSCHIRLCLKKAKFCFPEISFGLYPALEGINRSRQIAGTNVIHHILSGETFLPSEALSLGLVNRVFETIEEMNLYSLILINNIKLSSPSTIKHIMCGFSYPEKELLPNDDLFIEKLIEINEGKVLSI